MPLADKYIAKSSAIASRTLADELIIMSVVDSTLFTLNPTGKVIWEAADGNTPLSRIIEEKICAEFEIGIEQAYADAEQFVTALAEHGILLVSDKPFTQE
jgi:hypothetical protein